MSFGLPSTSLTVAGYSLRPLQGDDAAGLLALFADPAVAQFMDIEPLVHLDEAHEIIGWAQDMAREEAGIRWSVRRAGEPGLIGTVGFNTLVFERGCRGEVAYDLRRADWGRGVMSAILPAVLQFGFGRLGLQRIEAMVTLGNQRSCALLERHGFQREGLLRDYAFWKDRFWDQLIYARLAPPGA
jgi:ribosomal-protein-alanine N-acetyltransferase